MVQNTEAAPSYEQWTESARVALSGTSTWLGLIMAQSTVRETGLSESKRFLQEERETSLEVGHLLFHPFLEREKDTL